MTTHIESSYTQERDGTTRFYQCDKGNSKFIFNSFKPSADPTLPGYFYEDDEQASSSYEEDEPPSSAQILTSAPTPATPLDHFQALNTPNDTKGPCVFVKAYPKELIEREQEECKNQQEDEKSHENVFSKMADINEAPVKPVAGLAAPISRSQKHQSTVTMIKQHLRAFEGGDNRFKFAMSTVFTKMAISLGDRQSAYSFRDYAGTFTEFLNEFGPGASLSYCAPKNISWIIKLILPWLSIDVEGPEYDNYKEVCGWANNIVLLLGKEHGQEILEEGLWEVCCEQMTHPEPLVSEKAFDIAMQIVVTVDLQERLMNKIIMLRHMLVEFEDVECFTVRHYRIKMLRAVLDRIDKTMSNENALNLVNMAIPELELAITKEINPRVKEAAENCLYFAHEVYDNIENACMNIMVSPSYRDPDFNNLLGGFRTYSSETTDMNYASVSENNSQEPIALRKRDKFWNVLYKAADLIKKQINTNFGSKTTECPQDNFIETTEESHHLRDTINGTFRRLFGRDDTYRNREGSNEEEYSPINFLESIQVGSPSLIN